MPPFDAEHRLYDFLYSPLTETMRRPCTIFEILLIICRKLQCFRTHVGLYIWRCCWG